MKANGILFIVLGSLISIGGMIGFFVKGSIPSLLSGLSFGSILILSGRKTLLQEAAFEMIGLAATFFLDLFFAYRVLKTNHLLPAGIFILICSISIVIVCSNIKKRVNRIPTE